MKKKKKYKRPEVRKQEKLDVLHGKWVRNSGFCFAVGCDEAPGIECNSVLQYCHVLERSESPSLKRSPLNAIPMCSAHHMFFTHRPITWAKFLDHHLPGLTDRLWVMSIWATNNSGLFDTKEMLDWYIQWYSDRDDDWSSWRLHEMNDYEDYLETIIKQIEGK